MQIENVHTSLKGEISLYEICVFFVKICIYQKKAVPLRAKLAYYALARTQKHMDIDAPMLPSGGMG